MLTVAEALQAVIHAVTLGPQEHVSLFEAHGRILAEEIVSTVDSPPFDKALMDGVAIRAEDFQAGCRQFHIQEVITAGCVPTRPLEVNGAARIMTGAPVPVGATAVVPVEETRGADQMQVELTARTVAAEQFILRQGAAVRHGTRLMTPGGRIRAQELAALAELGQTPVSVRRRPRVGILATGDELVPADQRPGAGQIRNSNEPMLAAQITAAGGEAVCLGIARDERSHLRERILAGLRCDFLLLSGGVSAGQLDLVPSELAAAGVQQVFHKIQMKPGKPLWFGMRSGAAENVADGGNGATWVFGLPGNPVSSMVCCELFVRTALRKWYGINPVEPTSVTARLANSYPMQGNRPTYHPARWSWEGDGLEVEIVDWVGSADVCATVSANGMVLFPAGERTWQAGEHVPLFLWD